MKRLLFILFPLLLVFNASAQVQSTRQGNISTINVTNNLSDIGWQRDASNNVFLFALTDFVGIGIADPTVNLHMLSSVSGGPDLLLEGTDAGSLPVSIILEHDSASPADDDELGGIDFQGDNAAASNRNYVQVRGISSDVTTGDEAGELQLRVRMNDILRRVLNLNGFNGTVSQGEIIFNEDSQDFDFRVESDNEVNAFFVEGSTGNLGIGTASPSDELHMLSSGGGTAPALRLENTNAGAGGTGITFNKNSSSPADDDDISNIGFLGDNAAGSSVFFVNILAEQSDVSTNDHAGRLTFELSIDANLVAFLTLNGFNGAVNQGEVVINEDSRDLDFRIESDNEVNAFFIQGSTGNVGIGIGAPTVSLHLVDNSVANPVIIIENENSGSTSGTLRFIKDGGDANDNDLVGSVLFRGDNDAGTEVAFSQLEAFSDDVSANDEAGRVTLSVTMNATVRNLFTVDGFNGTVDQGEIIFNENSQDVDLRVESDNDATAFIITGSNGNVSIGGTDGGNALVLLGTPAIFETTQLGITLGVGATTFAATSNVMVIDGDGGGNTIGTITGFGVGGELTLIFVDASVIITDNNTHAADSVDLSAAFTSADDVVLKLVYDGVSWYEVSRSVN